MPASDPPYILYGSYASYYTAKTRACLRKKAIPFVEHLPSDPEFKARVRPTSGSHRIPQLLAPDGTVVQDSVEIQDYLEAHHPERPAIPSGPRQRVYVHLMELLASEGLVRLAWLHRWVFPENRSFVIRDFGRSFRPQGDDETLVHYGELIAERMMSYGLPESTPALRETLDRELIELLHTFERHLIDHPYCLGGHPSAADYALMGALHAHLGRDPAGLRVMQDHAPRVFRWVEHMQVESIAAPEFHNRPAAFAADDNVPATAVALLAHIAERYAEPFVLGALAFNRALTRSAATAGHVIDAEQDQPLLAAETLKYRGEQKVHRCNVYAEWLAQRARRYFQSLAAAEQDSVRHMLGAGHAQELLDIPVAVPLARRAQRLVIG
ncbi:MAG: glutathione S-transferase family protein [Pseudomonadota bacterium]